MTGWRHPPSSSRRSRGRRSRPTARSGSTRQPSARRASTRPNGSSSSPIRVRRSTRRHVRRAIACSTPTRMSAVDTRPSQPSVSSRPVSPASTSRPFCRMPNRSASSWRSTPNTIRVSCSRRRSRAPRRSKTNSASSRMEPTSWVSPTGPSSWSPNLRASSAAACCPSCSTSTHPSSPPDPQTCRSCGSFATSVPPSNSSMARSRSVAPWVLRSWCGSLQPRSPVAFSASIPSISRMWSRRRSLPAACSTTVPSRHRLRSSRTASRCEVRRECSPTISGHRFTPSSPNWPPMATSLSRPTSTDFSTVSSHHCDR